MEATREDIEALAHVDDHDIPNTSTSKDKEIEQIQDVSVRDRPKRKHQTLSKRSVS